MKISIIGSGYVGLSTLVGFSRNGHSVLCIDQDENIVAMVNKGIPPIREPGLDELLTEYLSRIDGSLAFKDFQQILNTDISFICVGTPPRSDGGIDLTNIERAIRELGRVLSRKRTGHIVVIKSTVVPGTTRHFIIPLLEKSSGKRVGLDLGIVVSPEFLQEGEAVQSAFNPHRIIIGESDQRSGDVVEKIYQDFHAPIIRTDLTTAEMIKYASNSFLATKLSFINEIGNICKKLGIDVSKVAQGMGYDPRIGNKYLNAGIGFGGSCLPKDLNALIHRAEELDYEPDLLKSVVKVNNLQLTRFLGIVKGKLGTIENKVITVLGLAFKPNTDDVREAPAISIISQLLNEGALVKAYDPLAMRKTKQIFPSGVEFCKNINDAVANSDCILILTEWDEFRNEALYTGKVVVDGRRVLDPQRAMKICEYEGICW